MSRYLTPARISLVVLIELYITDQLPTSQRIRVLDFIASWLNTASTTDVNRCPAHDTIFQDVSSWKEKLSQWPSSVPGRNAYDLFLTRLFELNGPDSIDQLVQKAQALVAPVTPAVDDGGNIKVSRCSPLGQFLRRCNVEFTRLQLIDSLALWRALYDYRVSQWDHWASRHSELALELQKRPASWVPAESPSTLGSVRGLVSFEDVDAVLSESVHFLQRFGTRLPPDLKSNLQKYLSAHGDSPVRQQSLHHFLSFFECWRAGELHSAIQSLHQYFDYSLIANGGADNLKVYYQYALLHKSVLYADFERWSESVDAMEECISTARENHDMICLNFALSWLLYLRQVHPDSQTASFQNLANLVGGDISEDDEITFLKRKAMDGKHWSLLSGTLLEEAKTELYRGGDTTKAMANVMQASYKNVQHDLRTLMPATTLFQGAAFERLGQHYLATAQYSNAVFIHSPFIPIADAWRANCRLIFAQMRGQTGWEIEKSGYESFEPTRGSIKMEQKRTEMNVLSKLRSFLYRGRFTDAKQAIETLRPVRGQMSDAETSSELLTLEVMFNMRQCNLFAAMKQVNAEIQRHKDSDFSDKAQHLHLLALKAKILALTRQPTTALSLALRVAASAQRLLLVGVLVEALGTLAGVLLLHSESQAAKALLEAALPLALEGSNAMVTGELYLHLSEAHLRIGMDMSEELFIQRGRLLKEALQYANRSHQTYEGNGDVLGQMQALEMAKIVADLSGDKGAFALAEGKLAKLVHGRLG